MINHFEEAKNKLVLKASNFAARYLLGKYGSAHLIGTPKVELTATEGPTSTSFVFNGAITVVAASDGLLNQVGVNMTINENDIEVTSEDVQANISSALNAAEEHSDVVVASLDSFKLHDDGSKYLKLSHTALQDANLGIVGKNEWAASPDKSELLQGMVKDAMLENNISFVGEFKEPTIEKEAMQKVASSDMPERFPEDHQHNWGRLVDPSNPDGDAYCVECNIRKSDFEKDSSKKSWLTASLLKQAFDFSMNQDLKIGDKVNVRNHDGTVVSEQRVQDVYSSEDEFNASQEMYGNTGLSWDGNEIVTVNVDMGDNLEEEFFVYQVNEEQESNINIKEDMPMARATDHLAQAAQLEEQLISASSEKIKNEAANALISMLHGMGYGTAKIAEVTSSKDGLDFMAAIDDGGSVKAVSIPVAIKEAKVVLPKKSLVSTLISKGLDVRAKLSEQFDAETLEKIAAIEEKIAFEAQEAIDILNEKPAAPVVKEANESRNTMFQGDTDTLTVQKHLLPDHENMKLHDKVSDGTDQWEIVNMEGQQNSKGEGDSSLWTMKKCTAPASDPKADEEKTEKKMPN